MDLSKGERKMNTTSNSLWVGYALLSACLLYTSIYDAIHGIASMSRLG